MLETATTSGIATMNLEAGAFTEEFIVESPKHFGLGFSWFVTMGES